MTRDETLQLLRSHSDEIRTRFGVKRLAVFGSIARDEARNDSDVDVLVEFKDTVTFKGFFDLKFFLEDTLKSSVDLATNDMIRSETRPDIEHDLIEVLPRSVACDPVPLVTT